MGRTSGEPKQPTWEQMQQLYAGLIDAGDGRGQGFDYTNGGFSGNQELRGTSRTSPYGAANPNDKYVAWHNPHGGSTFIGITPTGQKEFISREEAINLGFVPNIKAESFEVGTPSNQPPQRPGGGVGNDPFIPGVPNDYRPGYTDQQVLDWWAKNPDLAPDGYTPPGSGNPNTGNSGAPNYSGGGYNWDFEGGTPGAAPLFGGGGYNPDDFNFERYVPGQESPWGIPEIEGGNKDFYRNQFMNLLREDQNFQNKEIESAIRREYAQNNPMDAREFEWGSVGVRPAQSVDYDPATGAQSTQVLADWITPGVTTNYEIYSGLRDRGLLSQEFNRYIDDPNRDFTSTNLSKHAGRPGENPATLLSRLPPIGDELSQGNYDFKKAAYDAMFTNVGLEAPPGGGPVAAPGYALPIPVSGGQ